MAIHFADSHGGCCLLYEGKSGIKKVSITVSCSAQKYAMALTFFSEMAVYPVMTLVLIVL